jgi:hypothetical protein
VCSAPEAKGDGLGKGFRDFLWLPGGHNGLVFVLSYENHEGKDLAVMFLLVLVLLLLFFFIEIRLLVFGQDRVVVVPPGPVGSLSASATWLAGASPQTPRGLGRPPNFLARRISTPYLAPNPICKKINAPQNNYKPENALNASRIVFVPSLIPEGVLVHSNAMAGRSHAFRAVFCFPSAPESGAGQLGEGKSNY